MSTHDAEFEKYTSEANKLTMFVLAKDKANQKPKDMAPKGKH